MTEEKTPWKILAEATEAGIVHCKVEAQGKCLMDQILSHPDDYESVVVDMPSIGEKSRLNVSAQVLYFLKTDYKHVHYETSVCRVIEKAGDVLEFHEPVLIWLTRSDAVRFE